MAKHRSRLLSSVALIALVAANVVYIHHVCNIGTSALRSYCGLPSHDHADRPDEDHNPRTDDGLPSDATGPTGPAMPFRNPTAWQMPPASWWDAAHVNSEMPRRNAALYSS
jgi:hypothetical protein